MGLGGVSEDLAMVPEGLAKVPEGVDWVPVHFATEQLAFIVIVIFVDLRECEFKNYADCSVLQPANLQS